MLVSLPSAMSMQTIFEGQKKMSKENKVLILKGSWKENFAEFGDNRLLSCILVVCFNCQK